MGLRVRYALRQAADLRESRHPGPFRGRADSPFPVILANSPEKTGLDWKPEGDLPRYLLTLSVLVPVTK
jgi:hypothetical protein